MTSLSFEGVSVGSNDAKVRFEPCDAFAAGPEPAIGACAACGWLEEDHWPVEPATASSQRVPALSAPA